MSALAAIDPRREGETFASDAEYGFSWKNFCSLRDRLRAEAGIFLSDQKMTFMYSRLAKRLRARQLKSFDEYEALLDEPGAAEERLAFVSALTTNLTAFFRESHHFDHLERHVWPKLRSAAEAGMPVRIWSAGCSTGEEPYSIAMSWLRAVGGKDYPDVRILATDVDVKACETCREGVYARAQIDKLPLAYRSSQIERSGDRYRMSPLLRRMVVTRTLNLNGTWPMTKRFDVIFCRNTMIYFDGETQSVMLSRFADALKPGGHLFIGHSERMDGPAAALFRPVATTAFERRHDAGKPSSSSAWGESDDRR